MDSIVDTVMNLFVFAFVGLLIWLYLKETPSDEKDPGGDSPDDV
jgi:hypothetical protein